MEVAIHAVPLPTDVDTTDGWINWEGPHEELLQHRLRALDRRIALLHLDYDPKKVLVDRRAIRGVLD